MNKDFEKRMFAAIVDNSALNQVNPTEFYAKALLDNESIKMFRQFPGVTDRIKIATTPFNNLLQAFDCDFSPTDVTLKAKTFEVTPLKFDVEFCQKTLLNSFIASYTSKIGAIDFLNTDGLQPEFQAHIMGELNKKLQDEYARLFYQGDESLASTNFLSNMDGLVVKALDSATTIKLQGTSIDSSNVIDEMETIYNAIPVAISDVKLLVSTNVMRAYKLATAKANTIAYTTGELANKLIDLDIIEVKALPNNTVIATRLDNVGAIYDIFSADVRWISMKEQTVERTIRIGGEFAMGCGIIVDEELVIYSPEYVPAS